MNKQIRKDMLELGIEPMTRTGLHDQCSNHWAIEVQSSHIVFFSKWYFIIESISRRYDVHHALGYSQAISNQAKLMVNSFPPIDDKYDYSKERKGVYVIFYISYQFYFLWLSMIKYHSEKKTMCEDCASIAQWLEHWSCKPVLVMSLIPSWSISFLVCLFIEDQKK